MLTRTADWIIAHDGTNPARAAMSLECERCGATLAPSLPIAVDVWVCLARVFQREHRRCGAHHQEVKP